MSLTFRPIIVWSDDCLSCLANLPHSYKHHMKAVNDAFEALRQENEDLRRSLGDIWEDETGDNLDNLE